MTKEEELKFLNDELKEFKNLLKASDTVFPNSKLVEQHTFNLFKEIYSGDRYMNPHPNYLANFFNQWQPYIINSLQDLDEENYLRFSKDFGDENPMDLTELKIHIKNMKIS